MQFCSIIYSIFNSFHTKWFYRSHQNRPTTTKTESDKKWNCAPKKSSSLFTCYMHSSSGDGIPFLSSSSCRLFFRSLLRTELHTFRIAIFLWFFVEELTRTCFSKKNTSPHVTFHDWHSRLHCSREAVGQRILRLWFFHHSNALWCSSNNNT